jgi:ZIP family zinc transporter
LGALAVLISTGAGALVILLFKKIGRLEYSAMLAFAAGMMGYSAIEMLSQAHSKSGDAMMLAGLVLGIAALFLSDKLLPHVHKHALGQDMAKSKKKALIIVGTIALHNIPEGFAIAAAFAGSTPLGWFVTASIALQDFPEGTLVSAPLAAYGMDTRKSIGFGILSGVVEAAAAVIGYIFLTSVNGLVPLALSFSAGAMAYVIIAELVPDASEENMERVAAISLIAGAALSFIMASVFAF